MREASSPTSKMYSILRGYARSFCPVPAPAYRTNEALPALVRRKKVFPVALKVLFRLLPVHALASPFHALIAPSSRSGAAFVFENSRLPPLNFAEIFARLSDGSRLGYR